MISSFSAWSFSEAMPLRPTPGPSDDYCFARAENASRCEAVRQIAKLAKNAKRRYVDLQQGPPSVSASQIGLLPKLIKRYLRIGSIHLKCIHSNLLRAKRVRARGSIGRPK